MSAFDSAQHLRFACLITDEAHHEDLLASAKGSSPLIEEVSPGCICLDITGTEDEHRLLLKLTSPHPPLSRERERMGEAQVRGSAASTRSAALIAARISTNGPIVIPSGGEAAYLAHLPIEALDPAPDLAVILERWGLRTLGALAALPEGEVTRRLGPAGRLLHLAARGLDDHPMVAVNAEERFEEGARFDWAVYEIMPFLELGLPALEQLSARLRHQGLAARRLQLTLELEDGSRRTRSLALAAPTADVRTWQALLALELQRWPPSGALTGFAVEAQPEKARTAQLGLFEPPAQSPDLLATTIARLAALLGPERVGSPAVVNNHRPERFAMSSYDLNPRGPSTVTVPRGPRVAIRILRPAIELEAIAGAGGAPTELRSLRNTGTHAEIVGHVRTASGPWRLEDRWWAGDSAHREYWDVELSDGALYRVYCDLATARWFADGIYD